MLKEDIVHSLPLGPSYKDQDGNKVLVLALSDENNFDKIIGYIEQPEGGRLVTYDPEDLDIWIEPVDEEITVKESDLKSAVQEILGLYDGEFLDRLVDRLKRISQAPL